MKITVINSILFVTILLSLSIFFGFLYQQQGTDNIGNFNSSTAIFTNTGPQFSEPLSPLAESFESSTFPPTGWVKINVAPGATGFDRHQAGETPVPGFNYGHITTPPGGGQWVAFCNYLTSGTNSGDQWLCTPQIYNISPNDSLYFWLRKYGSAGDHFQIKISTTTQTPQSAYTIFIDSMAFHPADSGWVYHR